MPRRRALVPAVAAGWALLALVQTARACLLALSRGESVALGPLLRGELALTAGWALLTPGALAMAARFPATRLRSLPAHLAGAAAYAALHLGAASAAAAAGVLSPAATGFPVLRGGSAPALAAAAGLEVALYAATVGAWHASARWSRGRVRALRSAQLDAKLARAQLETLRSRLQPHFLFNTLHAISSLMASDVMAARRMLTDLADLLRLSLDVGQPHQVPLRDELAALERYVDIQRARFRGRLSVAFHVEPDAAEAQVPRLILQPLVESALEHGLSPRGAPGRVDVRAWLEGRALRLAVSDNGAGAPRGRERESGGLDAARERLRQIYGSEQVLELLPNSAGGVTVNVTIPLQGAGANPTMQAGQ
jgi:two-component system LytT family sensor kinase